MIKVLGHGLSDPGLKRTSNEDAFLVDQELGLYLVCDGVSGHAAGDVASKMTIQLVHQHIKKNRAVIEAHSKEDTAVARESTVKLIEDAINLACGQVFKLSRQDESKRGMATTVTLFLRTGRHAMIAHVGDSRIYLARGEKSYQLTEDHSLLAEELRRGTLTPEEAEKFKAANVITRAVGFQELVKVDTLQVELSHTDTYLLCSDGLSDYFQSNELAKMATGRPPDTVTKELVAFAKAKGGKDNITAVIVKLGEEGAGDEARARRLALKRDVLAKMPLFGRLSERELLRVMQAVEVREYEDGQVVIRAGDKGDELFIVLAGTVRVIRGEATLTRLGAGEHFGEMALIRSVPRSASVTAEGRAELIAIRRADFFEILRKEHEIAVKMLWQFLGVLADRLDQTSSELRHAKQELAAEDVTGEIFPDVDIEIPFG